MRVSWDKNASCIPNHRSYIWIHLVSTNISVLHSSRYVFAIHWTDLSSLYLARNTIIENHQVLSSFHICFKSLKSDALNWSAFVFKFHAFNHLISSYVIIFHLITSPNNLRKTVAVSFTYQAPALHKNFSDKFF